MQENQNPNIKSNFFETTVLGHPAGLFVLFFTEMWERFSYYGMRALLVLFLISSFGMGGWDWSYKEAFALYGTYTSMVYLTPILGGYLADKYLGYRKAVVWGAVVMTLGHAAMAVEHSTFFLYIGIGLLIIGNGLFKPNMTSIISHMYKNHPKKKDGAYTIFYMGVNAGAFLGIMLCGYIGEKVSWTYGFGLAGIFMFLGMLQFFFAQKILGKVGVRPVKFTRSEIKTQDELNEDLDELNKLEPVERERRIQEAKRNPYTTFDYVFSGISTVLGLLWIFNNLMNISDNNFLDKISIFTLSGSNFVILTALISFFIVVISRLSRYAPIVRDKMIAVIIFAFFTVFFWASFEQAGGSMTIFAEKYTDRLLTGDAATAFIIIDIIITVVPVAIISWVLFLLFKKTIKKYLVANLILASSFLLIWFIIGWKIDRDSKSVAYIVDYPVYQSLELNKETNVNDTIYVPISESTVVPNNANLYTHQTEITEPIALKIGDNVNIYDKSKEKSGEFKYMNAEKTKNYYNKIKEKDIDNEIVIGTINKVKDKGHEIPATWFGILNSLFIIMFAPFFSKWWESKYNPNASAKYGFGMILLGLGFGALALGSADITSSTDFVPVSIIWLILAYLFHTLGELCISPVGLSYVSKLVPGRMIAFMFGIWYLAIAIGNGLAAQMGGKIEEIQNETSISFFFSIFFYIPVSMGILAILINKLIKRFMHDVK